MLNTFFKKSLSLKERFFIFLSLLFLYVLPLILKDVLYYDDNNRVLHGHAYWDVDGRPLTDLVMYLLNFNIGNIGNISPLPLLLSVLSLAGVFTYISEKINMDKTITNILPILLFVINPFFLQNLSYQYDCIGMSLGISFALLAYFYDSQNKKMFIVPSLFIAASFAFYQPCANIFLALFFADILVKFKIKENYLKNVLLYGLRYLLGVLIYYIVQFYIVPVSPTRTEIIHISQFWSSLIVSWEKLSEFITPLLHSSLLMFFILFSFCMLILLGARICSAIKNKSTVEFFLLLTVPIGLFLSMWGPLLLLKELLFNPREFPSLGVMFFAGILSLYSIDKRQWIFRIVSILLTLVLFSFSYQYANALKYQRDYDNRIFSWISYDLSKLDVPDKKVYLYGEIPRTVLAQRIIENNPFIAELEKPSFRWVARAILQGMDMPNVSRDVSFDDKREWELICNTNKANIAKTQRYVIFEFENHISVWLLKENKPLCQIQPENFENIFSKNLE